MPSYLLRVQLTDRPGSLGSLAVALGSAGADILSLDVVDRNAGVAIDDLLVELPHGSMPDVLITAAERLPGVRVESVRPYTGLLDAHSELELIGDIAAAGSRREKLQILAEEAPRALTAGWCLVGRQEEGRFHRLAASLGAPETGPESAPWLPIRHATTLDADADWVPDAWRDVDVALVAAPLDDSGIAALLGRSGGPAFRPAEVTRLDHLTGIVTRLIG